MTTNLPPDPKVFEGAMRAIAAREATRGPCPFTGEEHVMPSSALERLARYGGRTECVVCHAELRLIERPRVDVALSMVDTARVWAGLPRFTEMQRTFLRAVLGGRDPIITALQEAGVFYDIAHTGEIPAPIEEEPDPESAG